MEQVRYSIVDSGALCRLESYLEDIEKILIDHDLPPDECRWGNEKWQPHEHMAAVLAAHISGNVIPDHWSDRGRGAILEPLGIPLPFEPVNPGAKSGKGRFSFDQSTADAIQCYVRLRRIIGDGHEPEGEDMLVLARQVGETVAAFKGKSPVMDYPRKMAALTRDYIRGATDSFAEFREQAADLVRFEKDDRVLKRLSGNASRIEAALDGVRSSYRGETRGLYRAWADLLRDDFDARKASAKNLKDHWCPLWRATGRF